VYRSREAFLLSEVLAHLLGIGTGELLGASERIERALGSLVLRFGRLSMKGTGTGVDPIVTISLDIDLRKLKTVVMS
jgi:hypothetical protein